MRPLRYAALSLAVVLLYPYAAYGQPAFTDVTAGDLLTDVRSWGASWVDADGDGDLDLFVSRFGPTGGNELFVNTDGAFTRLTGTPLTDGVGSIGHSWADYRQRRRPRRADGRRRDGGLRQHRRPLDPLPQRWRSDVYHRGDRSRRADGEQPRLERRVGRHRRRWARGRRDRPPGHVPPSRPAQPPLPQRRRRRVHPYHRRPRRHRASIRTPSPHGATTTSTATSTSSSAAGRRTARSPRTTSTPTPAARSPASRPRPSPRTRTTGR